MSSEDDSSKGSQTRKKQREEDILLCREGRCEVRMGNYMNLREGYDLDDALVNYFCQLAHAKRTNVVNYESLGQSFIADSLFFAQLQKYKDYPTQVAYQKTKSWIPKKISLFDLSFFGVPVCVEEHWFFVGFFNLNNLYNRSKRRPYLLVFDSASVHTNRYRHVTTIVKFLYEYYSANLPYKKTLADKLMHIPNPTVGFPQQPNDHDCGLYVIWFVETILDHLEALLDKPPEDLMQWFDASKMKNKRADCAQWIAAMSCFGSQETNVPRLFPRISDVVQGKDESREVTINKEKEAMATGDESKQVTLEKGKEAMATVRKEMASEKHVVEPTAGLAKQNRAPERKQMPVDMPIGEMPRNIVYLHDVVSTFLELTYKV